MTETISRLFMPSVQAAVDSSVSQKRPLFVYIAPDSSELMVQKFLCSENLEPDQKIMATLAASYVCLRLVENTSEFCHFQAVFPAATCPSFYIVQTGKLLEVVKLDESKQSFAERLYKHAREKPLSSHDRSVRSHMAEVARLQKEQREERKRIRRLIEADRKERTCVRNNTSAVPRPVRPASDTCQLSIRLLDGETIRGEFRAHETLKDVLRWIEKEKNMLLVPEEDTSMPSFARPECPTPSHYAFCHPGVPTVTFSEGQELSRLRDLGLCPRLALILKPVYDEKALQPEAGSQSVVGSLKGKMTVVLHALYSFFDYGVDDASRDLYETADDHEPIFLPVAPAGPVRLSSAPLLSLVPQTETKEPKEAVRDITFNTNGRMTPVPGSNLVHILQDEVKTLEDTE